MDDERDREAAERDQLWDSLQALLPEILLLAKGPFGGSERERQLVQVLARVVASELKFRAERSEPE